MAMSTDSESGRMMTGAFLGIMEGGDGRGGGGGSVPGSPQKEVDAARSLLGLQKGTKKGQNAKYGKLRNAEGFC